MPLEPEPVPLPEPLMLPELPEPEVPLVPEP